MSAIGFVLAMLVVVVTIGKISDRLGLPDAVLLTVVGLVYALLPGPNVRLQQVPDTRIRSGTIRSENTAIADTP